MNEDFEPRRTFKKETCKQCPFLKTSPRGWLGGFSVDETIQTALSELTFQCHPTRETGNETECAGRLLFAKINCKKFRNKTLNEMQERLIETNTTQDILNYSEFKKHHEEFEND